MEVIEGVVLNNAQFIACGIALGSAVGRDEGVVSVAVGESACGLNNHFLAGLLFLAEDRGEEVLRIQAFGDGLMDEGCKGSEEVLL